MCIRDRNYYTNRVQRDFSNLVNKNCFYAYDTGASIEEANIPLPASVTNPLVQGAFKFRSASGTDLACHDATYVSGGYFLDMSFNLTTCLLYTSDAADDLLCVDLGGRRIIKTKNTSIIDRGRRVTEAQLDHDTYINRDYI
eukprot:TRINITY_DN4416_c0_g1_i1.p1 TRINITY_DN4416_c0_g1~~TRINITY_DN4416_c0_g1_i1.p1  ORF type:complete len:141 (-),score=21.86 TRINITY_DN4416_c0_g1_i1:1-423(-)